MSEINKKIIVYGAGERGENLLYLLQNSNKYDEIIVVDGNSNLWGSCIGNNSIVQNPDTLRSNLEADVTITAGSISNYREIRYDILNKYNYCENKIIFYEKLIWELLEENILLPYKVKDNDETSMIFESYTGLGMGGIQQWTIDIVRGLNKRRENRVKILTDNEIYQIPAELQSYIDKIAREGTDIGTECKENFDHIINYLLNKLPAIIIVNRPNVVTMAACTLKKYYPDKINIISVIHNGTNETYRRYLTFKEYVDLYIGVSQDIKKDLLNNGIEKGKVTSMWCPFDCDVILKRDYSIDSGLPIKIAYAGRLDGMKNRQKRMDLILDLIRELDSNKINFTMEIAGEGPARRQMEDIIFNLGIQDKVTFVGKLYRSNIGDFWKKQDICINLADYEGRSISIIEAMGNGVVPIVTNTSGVNEDIVSEENGFIVEIGDYKEAAKKIKYLEKNRKNLPIMGKKAHEAVYPKSDIEEHIGFWNNIINAILEKR